MYRYVSSLRASHYKTPPPTHQPLSVEDVPEAELEMREILNNWYTDGLLPIIQAEKTPTSPQEQQRFDKLTRTVGTLLRDKDYYFATKRIVSLWKPDSIEATYITYLLYRSE